MISTKNGQLWNGQVHPGHAKVPVNEHADSLTRKDKLYPIYDTIWGCTRCATGNSDLAVLLHVQELSKQVINFGSF